MEANTLYSAPGIILAAKMKVQLRVLADIPAVELRRRAQHNPTRAHQERQYHQRAHKGTRVSEKQLREQHRPEDLRAQHQRLQDLRRTIDSVHL